MVRWSRPFPMLSPLRVPAEGEGRGIWPSNKDVSGGCRQDLEETSRNLYWMSEPASRGIGVGGLLFHSSKGQMKITRSWYWERLLHSSATTMPAQVTVDTHFASSRGQIGNQGHLFTFTHAV